MKVKGRKKGSSTGNDICNTKMLYSGVMCLLSVGQISLEDLFFYEFSPVPKFCLQLQEKEDSQKIKRR